MKRVGMVLLFVFAAIVASNVNAQVTFDEASQNQMVMTNMASMPLAFTENRGQWNEKALFKADAGGATFWFCGDEIAYVFTRNTDELLDDDMHIPPSAPSCWPNCEPAVSGKDIPIIPTDSDK